MKQAIIAYLPVIHAGVINFLNKYPKHQVFVIGNDILDQLAEDCGILALKRDPRILSINYTIALIKTIRCNNHVGVLKMKDIEDLEVEFDGIVMPDEDVTRRFGVKFLTDFRGKIDFDQTFLRWDMPKSTSQISPDCDRTISLEEARQLGFDVFIDHAYRMAGRSSDWWRQVGAVMVREREVMLSAFNHHMPHEYQPYICGDPRSNFDAGKHIELSTAGHAEVTIIAEAAKRGILTAGAEMFVTTFPCGNCSKMIAQAGFSKIYFVEGYSQLDSIDTLKAHRVEIIHVLK